MRNIARYFGGALLIGATLILGSCAAPLGGAAIEGETGAVKLILSSPSANPSNTSGARTLAPAKPTISFFDVKFQKPSDNTIVYRKNDLAGTTSSTTLDRVPVGTWKLVVDAYTSTWNYYDGYMLASGTASVTVTSDGLASASVTLTYASGTGILTIDLSWPTARNDLVPSATISSLEIIGATPQTIALSVNSTQATANPSQASGIYLLTLKLRSSTDSTVKWGRTEVLYVLPTITTSATFALGASEINP
jgi:hypothetical protein